MVSCLDSNSTRSGKGCIAFLLIRLGAGRTPNLSSGMPPNPATVPMGGGYAAMSVVGDSAADAGAAASDKASVKASVKASDVNVACGGSACGRCGCTGGGSAKGSA